MKTDNLRMKADQIAVYCVTEKEAGLVKQMLGLTDESKWVRDTVTAKVQVMLDGMKPTHNVAELQFNDQLGIQFEVIRYVEGPHWCQNMLLLAHANAAHPQGPLPPFFAHLGFHLEPGSDWPDMRGAPLVQEARTQLHTNEELIKSGKTYHYRIYQVGAGTFFKFIKRIEKA